MARWESVKMKQDPRQSASVRLGPRKALELQIPFPVTTVAVWWNPGTI